MRVQICDNAYNEYAIKGLMKTSSRVSIILKVCNSIIRYEFKNGNEKWGRNAFCVEALRVYHHRRIFQFVLQ